MKDSSWIEWKGGDCPVDGQTMIDVKFRYGACATSGADCFNFTHDDHKSSDIIAYRLHKAGEPAQDCATIEPEPTIEQLAADYRAKLATARQAQEEADSHRCGAEAALEKLVSSGKALGLVLSVAEPDPELVITDWRDLLPGDELVALRVNNVDDADGKRCFVVKTQDNASGVFVYAKFDDGNTWWVREWRFIRRP